MGFPLTTKLMTLDDLFQQFRVMFQCSGLFKESTASNQMQLDSYYLWQKCSSGLLFYVR